MARKKRKRDYKKEYAATHGTPEGKRKRAMRNKARRRAERQGKVKKGDGKEVDHKNHLSKGGSNSEKNVRIVSRKENRKRQPKRKKRKRSKK